MPPGFFCTIEESPVSVKVNLDLDGNILDVNFLLLQENRYENFEVGGAFGQRFLLGETWGWGSISLWVPFSEKAAWENRVVTEILYPSGNSLVLVDTLPAQRITGALFISKSWQDLRDINLKAPFLIFRVKSVEDEILYESNFNTQQFWNLDHRLKQAARQMRAKIKDYKNLCQYHENLPWEEIILTQN